MTAGERHRLRQALGAHLPDGRTLPDDMNFFEAGLTSKSLTAALADLGPAGATLTLVDFFRFPTLRRLGDELARRDDRHRPAVSRQPGTHGGARPLPWRSEPARRREQ